MSNLDELKKHYYMHLQCNSSQLNLQCIFKECSSDYKCKSQKATKQHFSLLHRFSLIEDLRPVFFNRECNSDQIEHEDGFDDSTQIDYTLNDVSFKGTVQYF